MKRASILGLAMLWGLSQALGQAEPEVHLQSIRQAPYQGQNAQGITGDSAFLEYALAHILMAPEDVMFVSNRDLLQSLCLEACDEQEVVILDTVAGGGKPVHLRMTRRAFVPEAHTYAYFEGSDSLIESIDGRPAYGAVDRLPTWSIDTLEVQWGRRSLKVPEEAFADLYDPNFCDADLFRRPLAAYPSLSGRYLYLYVYGGSGGSTYFAKLVFDQKRYLTKIVAEYPDLLRFEAFRDDFIGF